MKRLYVTISLGILAALVVASVATSQILRLDFDRNIREKIHKRVRGQAVMVEQILNETPESALAPEVRKLRGSLFHPLTLVLGSSERIPPEIRDLQRHHRHPQLHTKEGRVIYVPVHHGKYYAVIGPIKRPFPFDLYHILLVLAVSLPIVGVTGYLLSYPVAKRLRLLEQATVRISEGDLHARANVTSTDAIGKLARRFNEMADYIHSLLEDQRHLLQAVSHELRTPISRIRFNLELLSGETDADQCAKRIAQIDNELDELNEMVAELLLYVRFDENELAIKKAPLDAVQVIAQVVDRLSEMRPEVTVSVAEISPDVHLFANPNYFKRALKNLLTNAIRYADSQVTVACQAIDNAVEVTVRDDGPGVPADQRERIFQPFARVDGSRDRGSGGVGLGLAIVDRILRSHGGTVSVKDNGGPGVGFVTRWPNA